MMSNVDMSKPVWKVYGRIKHPDNRRLITFVNASDEPSAFEEAMRQDSSYGAFESAHQVDVATGLKKA